MKSYLCMKIVGVYYFALFGVVSERSGEFRENNLENVYKEVWFVRKIFFLL